MPDRFYLTPEHVSRLSRMLDSFENGELSNTAGADADPRWISAPAGMVSGFLTSAIPQRTVGDFPASGELNLYSFTSTGVTDLSQTQTVYSFRQVAITTAGWTHATLDRTGKYVVTQQDGGSVIVGYLDSAITGLASLNSNPKEGTLSIYTATSTGQADTGTNKQVLHLATVDATTDRWTQCKQDWRGKWFIDYQPCSTT